MAGWATQAQCAMHTLIQWTESQQPRQAHWRSENGSKPPTRLQVVDDTLNADTAYRLACEGTALLWRGDFHNARQLLQALDRRASRAGRKLRPKAQTQDAKPITQAFHLHRQAQAQRARVLGMLVVELDAHHQLHLRRAPDLRPACLEAWGPPSATDTTTLVSLRELLGLVGAHEWRKKGVPVAALRGADANTPGRIHPHYGVFSPVRGEYVDLVAQAPLPPDAQGMAMDVGTGTGVLAAVLAQRGVAQVLATDQDPRALACARDNLERLGLAPQVTLLQTDLFAPGQVPLVVCNPPWLPARPATPIEHAVYDEGSRMLRGFLAGVAAHLRPEGEAWLILSDLAEHLGLRNRDDLLAWIAQGGLEVVGRLDTRPRHNKATDPQDPLHVARVAEITSLWRLRRQLSAPTKIATQ